MVQKLLHGLNPQQLDAVTTAEGPLLILAGAGTGKTRVITVRLAHLVAEGIPPQRLLAVTFTNKAAREMRERVRKLVSKSAATAVTISTFHSFSVRLLRKFGERLGLRREFTIADEDDIATLLRSALRELGIGDKTLSPRAAQEIIADWKNRALTPDQALEIACDDREVLAANAYRRLAAEMAHRQVIDFDDMILLSARLFDEHSDVLEQCRDIYRYLMVDEYQDTNAAQFTLLRRLAGDRRNVCVVGDDDQSIYGWRGAQAGNILNFGKHFPGAKIVTLEQNYRSTNIILKAANAVISNNTSRREKKLWSALGEGEPITLYKAEDEKDEVRWIVSRLNERILSGTPHENLAILFRANAQSNPIEFHLRERKIPYRLVGANSLFDRREVRDLLAYLRVIANPRDDGALLRIINTPPRGLGKTTQSRLIEAAVERRGGAFELIRSGTAEVLDPKNAEAFASLRILAETVQKIAPTSLRSALDHLLEAINYRAFLAMEYPDPLDVQMRSNTMDELLRAADTFDLKHPGAGLHEFLETLALDRDARQDDDVSRKTGVTLMTVHAAKGLEFEEVWIAGVEEGIFPHKNSLGDDEGTDTIDEERRLFYVAITRARRRLSMSYCTQRTKWGRIENRMCSRFVREIDDDLVKQIDPARQGPADTSTALDAFAQLKAKFGMI